MLALSIAPPHVCDGALIEEQWAIKLPRLRPLERIHLLLEIVECRQRDSILHASVGKHGR